MPSGDGSITSGAIPTDVSSHTNLGEFRKIFEMASEWHYRLGERELGPIAYRELIQLVRDGTVREDDLVRAEWPMDWQRADSVVGLFHMARRQESPAAPEHNGVSAEATAADDASPIFPACSSSRSWLPQLLSVLFRRSADSSSCSPPSVAVVGHRNREEVPETASAAQTQAAFVADRNDIFEVCGDIAISEKSEDETTEAASASGADEWAKTMADALQAARARDAALAREQERERSQDRVRGVVHFLLRGAVGVVIHPIMLLFGWIADAGGAKARDRVAAGIATLERWSPRPGILRMGFKLGTAIIAANLAAFGVLSWSDRQALRFPGTGSEMGRTFPIIGECGPAEFGLLVFHVALFAGIAAYGVAAVMEANADD